MVRYKKVPASAISEADIPDMKKRFLELQPATVLNQRSIEDGPEVNPERRQLVTKHYNRCNRTGFSEAQQALLKICEEETLKIVKELLPGIVRFKTIESLLHSRKRSKSRQKPHRDLRNLDNDAALALIAFEPNTRFIIFRGTHIHDGKIGIDNVPVIYELDVGDILVFHPSLIHAGDRYWTSNLRLHYYMISTEKKYNINETYPAADVAEAQ